MTSPANSPLRVQLVDLGGADTRRGRKALAELTESGRRDVEVGLFEGAGSPGEGGVAGPVPATYMFFQEFGTERLDEKPWMRTALEKGRSQYGDLFVKYARKIARGEMTSEAALFEIGRQVANDFKLSITNFGLVDTGTARNAVTWQVVEDLDFGGLPLSRAELR